MLANSTSYSQSHPYSQHPHNLQSVPVAYLDNMSGWSREYANAAPREATSSARPSLNHHQSSSSSIHEMGNSSSSNGQPSSMTMSQSSPALPFTTWSDNQGHHQNYHQQNLTSSTSSPSLLFDHGGIQGHVDQSNNHNFGYNGNGSANVSPANYRTGYSGGSNVKPYGMHPTPLTSSASYPSLPTIGSQHAAAAMYHQQHTAPVPSYLHQHSSSYTGSASNLAAPASVGPSLPETKGLPASLLSSPTQSTHNHQQRQQDNAYTLSASASNGSNNQNSLPASPSLTEFNSDYRSSHLLHPFEVKHRRRTTRTQFKVLEATFRENPKPNASVRKSVSQQLDMPVRAVQIWFQNRRAKAKAAAKREGANQMGDADQDNEDLDHYQSQYIEDEDGQRYSASPTSSLRRTNDSNGVSYHSTPASASSETFKIPSRPLRIDTEASNRRMTTGTMSSSATFTGNSYYHSPPLSSSGSLGQYSSHLSNSSPSFDTRPSVSSLSSSTSYDDRYRRGAVTSPGVLLHDNSNSVTGMGYPPQRQPPFHSHQQFQHQPPHQYNQHHQQQYHHQHHHPSSQIDLHLPSAFDPETRRLSLPDNIPADAQMSGSLSLLQQQQHHLHPQQLQHQQQQQQQSQLSHHRSAEEGSSNPTTDYWRY